LLLFSVLDQKRTILIPVGNPNKVSVSGSSADTTYLRAMGRYVAGLGLNYNPGSVRQQYEELLSLFSPEHFASAKQQLYEAADTVETAGASSVFLSRIWSIIRTRKSSKSQATGSCSYKTRKLMTSS
jgi:conjugal transfer pilus assembly protein TraE